MRHKLNSRREPEYQKQTNNADEFLQKTIRKACVVFPKIGNRILYTENKRRNICLADAVLSNAVGVAVKSYLTI